MPIKVKDLEFQKELSINDTKYIFSDSSIGLFTIDELEDPDCKLLFYRAEFKRPFAKSYGTAGQFDSHSVAYEFLNRIWREEVRRLYTSSKKYVISEGSNSDE